MLIFDKVSMPTNLESFLDCTTPLVPSQFLPKVCFFISQIYNLFLTCCINCLKLSSFFYDVIYTYIICLCVCVSIPYFLWLYFFYWLMGFSSHFFLVLFWFYSFFFPPWWRDRVKQGSLIGYGIHGKGKKLTILFLLIFGRVLMNGVLMVPEFRSSPTTAKI